MNEVHKVKSKGIVVWVEILGENRSYLDKMQTNSAHNEK